MKKNKVLVVGATGFIGKHLIKKLFEEGYSIRCLVRERSKPRDTDYLRKFNVELFYGDLNNPESLDKIDKGIENVYYLAGGGEVASLSERDYDSLKKYNLSTLENFLKSAKNFKKIIFFSSVSAMGAQVNKLLSENTNCNPIIPHELCKLESEKIIERYSSINKYDYAILRPTIVYGEFCFGDSFKFFKMLNSGILAIPGNGRNITPWVYVENVVNSAILLMTKGSGVYIINQEEQVSFNKIKKSFSQFLNKKIVLIHIPAFLIKPFVLILEKISLFFNVTPIINTYRLNSMTSNRFYSLEKIKKVGYKEKINFNQGLIKTLRWYKQNGYF